MTDEQIEHFAAECESSFKRGARWAGRRAFVGYMILIAGVFGMYWNGQHVSGAERNAMVESGRAAAVDACNRDYRSTERFRGLLARAKTETVIQHRRHRITDSQYSDARGFYARELNKLPLPDCRRVKVVVTSDPDKPIVIPRPLHPPDKA